MTEMMQRNAEALEVLIEWAGRWSDAQQLIPVTTEAEKTAFELIKLHRKTKKKEAKE